jgi:hypothetical protein
MDAAAGRSDTTALTPGAFSWMNHLARTMRILSARAQPRAALAWGQVSASQRTPQDGVDQVGQTEAGVLPGAVCVVHDVILTSSAPV